LPEWEVGADSAERLGDGAGTLTAILTGKPAERPTAVFAAGYYLALETMNVARDAGLRLPEDLSVVGYDDPYSAQFSYPPLTTVRQPLAAMGGRAVELLDRYFEGEEDFASPVLIPPELQVRGSTSRADDESSVEMAHPPPVESISTVSVAPMLH
jgi:DNA-binding LacI/PurR family transcriptional regulator